MIKIAIFLLFLIISPAGLFAAVELDTDDNGATDIGYGGTNATTESGARTALGVPATAATLVGDCTVGPCLDGTADGGNLIKLWAGTGSYWTALQGGAPEANRSWRLPIAAPPSAGTTRLVNMDEYGQMAFVDPATFQTADAQLDTWAAVTPSANGQSLVSAANYAAMRALLDLEPGIDYDASTPSTLATTTDTSISAAQLIANKYITNQGASAEVDNVLPAISYHLTRAIIVEEEQIIETCPPSGETFELLISGTWTMLDADDCVDSPAIVGSRALVHRMQNASGAWFYSWDVVRGTWADTGASD